MLLDFFKLEDLVLILLPLGLPHSRRVATGRVVHSTDANEVLLRWNSFIEIQGVATVGHFFCDVYWHAGDSFDLFLLVWIDQASLEIWRDPLVRRQLPIRSSFNMYLALARPVLASVWAGVNLVFFALGVLADIKCFNIELPLLLIVFAQSSSFVLNAHFLSFHFFENYVLAILLNLLLFIFDIWKIAIE